MLIRSKIQLCITIGLLSLAISGLAGYRVTQLLIETSHWVAHTYKVEKLLEAVLSQLKDAETGQRGYLLTGTPEYLEPYESGRSKIADILETARILIKDNPTQQQRIDQIATLTEEKLAELRNTINLYKRGENTRAFEVIMAGSGKQSMDDIRAIVAVMKSEEARLLATRKRETKSAVQIASWVTSFGNLLAFLIIGGIAIVLGRDASRYITERDYAELQRNETIEKLEQSLLEIKTLKGIIPICSYCKVIRNDKGTWEQLESYISAHSDAQFSHGACPECVMRIRAEEGV